MASFHGIGCKAALSRRLSLSLAVSMMSVLLGELARGQEHAPGDIELTSVELAPAGGRKLAAERGRLFVEENREQPGGATIELAFARLKSTSPKPGAPIVYLHGGPGGAATPVVRDPDALAMWARFLDLGDVILLDQRGCGSSLPPLARSVSAPLPADFFRDRASFGRFLVSASREIAAQFEKEGIDVTGYTTVQSADDLDDLRVALGVPKLRLLGFSYGTHLAPATIRRHAAAIDAAVVIGVEGPAHTRKLPSTYDTQFRKLARMVAADRELAPKIPDLVALLQRVLARAEKEPFVVRLPEAASGKPGRAEVGAFGLRLILMADMGDASDLPVIPRLLFDLDRGDTTLLAWFVAKRRAMFVNFPTLLFTMDPASGWSEGRALEIAQQSQSSLLGDAMDLDFPEVDTLWKVPMLEEDFRAPIVADVRTLFVSGTLDNNTPPFQAEEVRWGFRNSAHLILEGAGHESWLELPAVFDAIHRHFEGKDVAGTKIDVPPLRFVPLTGSDPQRTHPSITKS